MKPKKQIETHLCNGETIGTVQYSAFIRERRGLRISKPEIRVSINGSDFLTVNPKMLEYNPTVHGGCVDEEATK